MTKAKSRPCVSYFPTLINLKKGRGIKTAKRLLKALVREEQGGSQEDFREFKEFHQETDSWDQLQMAIDMVIKDQALILLDKMYPDDGSLETLKEMAKLIAEKHPELDTAIYDTSDGEGHEGCLYLVGFKK